MPQLAWQRKNDVLIVQFTADKILDDVVIAQIGHELFKLADWANGKMLLDLQGVAFMSSSMIGKIVQLNKKCKANKTEMKMCNVPSGIVEVLDKRRLDKFFKIYDSVDEALIAFGESHTSASLPSAS
jgi:anti-sigma B factor antagonist